MSQSPVSEELTDDYSAGWSQILDLINSGGSWSGHERNCCFLNTGQPRFANASAVTGFDFLDDSRAIAPVDWDHDGDLDLWLVGRTGPRLRFIRNDAQQAGKQHFLALHLTGTACNRDAIGAQLQIQNGDKTLLRTVRAGDGYLGQGSKWLHVGLGDAEQVDSVSVLWPGGQRETFTGVTMDGRFRLTQGTGQAEAWQTAPRSVTLEASRLPTQLDSATTRLPLADRIPLPRLDYTDFSGSPATLPNSGSGPVWLSFFATWCEPCLVEMKQTALEQEQIREAGLRVVALSVDGLGDDRTTVESAKQAVERLKFPFAAGAANAALVDKLDAFEECLISLRTQPNALPKSYLIDEFGRLAVIYTGQVSVEQVLQDTAALSSSEPTTKLAFPFPGRWFAHPRQTGTVLAELVGAFRERGNSEDALRLAGLAADLSTRDAIAPAIASELATLFYNDGNKQIQAGDLTLAKRRYEACIQLTPEWPEPHANLGAVYRQQGNTEDARKQLAIAIQMNPELLPAHVQMGLLLLDLKRPSEAVHSFHAATKIDEQNTTCLNLLGIALARAGSTDSAVEQFRKSATLGNMEAREHINNVLSGKIP
ncbi:MAG TPA: hypothetical protein DCY79_11020 [Planctomycetaceae bacterium]|nr:hypothetical protein [Blastopirellula sp.]HAY80327.1 hypothetical protein [Planctomycetaceae bacterium]